MNCQRMLDKKRGRGGFRKKVRHTRDKKEPLEIKAQGKKI